MIPILFDSNETTFDTNGLGRLDAISCKVNEELNGLYELELVYPVSGPRFSDLVVSNIIVAMPYDGAQPQPFRIYKVSKAMGGRVSVSARHITYQLNWIPVMPFNYSSLANCLVKLKQNSVYTNPFTFLTNKTVTTGGAFTEPLPCRSMLGGVQGSILQRYGGDYEWDGWTVRLWKRRGSDKGVRISYGKNLIDAKQETNIENTYTGICPYYIDSDTDAVTTLPEKYILASTASNFPFLRIQPVDFSSEWEESPTVAQLRARANQYITANNIGHPNVSVDVDFVALWQTEEYKNIAPLERVQLGDTVTVHFDKFDLDEQARVVAYEFDSLKERYNSITIGNLRSSLAKTFVDQGAAIETTADSLKSDISKSTSWLTRGNGFVVAVKNTDGSWKELLFLDTPSVETAQKVLRINENGIGFSDNGVNGSYAQAWTLDGTLSLGGLNNAYGNLILLSNSGKKTLTLDKSGMALYDSSGRLIAEFTQGGTYFDHYNGQGQFDSEAYLDGNGLYVAAESGSEDISIAPGFLDITSEDGSAGSYRGDGLDVAGVSIYENRVDAETVAAGTLEVNEILSSGSEGQSVQFSILGNMMSFSNGVLTEFEEGSGGESGGGVSDTIMVDGNILTFENGILVEVDSE